MPLSTVLSCLPSRLRDEITRTLSSPLLQGIRPAEVRLRQGRIASLTLYRDGRLCNLPLSFVADEDDLKTAFSQAVGGSLYAYEEAIKQGYVTLSGGIRVGVAGRVFCKDARILSLTAIHSLVFRLPSGRASAEELFSFYKQANGGILLFSPPGCGKTTLLRAFAALAAKEERVAVIDEREELFWEEGGLFIDRLMGYPKAMGAEIAVRTLSPELLILDELGASEARALASLVSFGVRTVASVHGGCKEELFKNAALSPLFRSGVFSHLWDVRQHRAFSVSDEVPL